MYAQKVIVHNAHTLHTVRNVHNAHCAYRFKVQSCDCINFVRAIDPDCSLADIYDEVAMPPELRKAHQNNDRAVMQAYGFSIKNTTESMCVAELMKMYQKLVEN